MSIVNRRNALLGWGVWTVMKSASKRKAKKAVHEGPAPTRKRTAGAAAGAVVAGTGAALVWRRKKRSDPDAS